MAQEPSHLVEAHAIPKPRGGGEVTQGMRMQPPIWCKTRLGTQPMQDLDKMSALEWTPLVTHEEEIFTANVCANTHILADRPRRRWCDECHTILLPLPERMKRLRSAGFQCSMRRCSTSLALSPASAITRNHGPIPEPLGVFRALEKDGSQLIFGRNHRQRLRVSDAETHEGVTLNLANR